MHWEPIFASRGLTLTIEKAMSRRSTGKAFYNATSSRSHCFLTMRVTKRARRRGMLRGDGAADEEREKADEETTITLVDLAGAEKLDGGMDKAIQMVRDACAAPLPTHPSLSGSQSWYYSQYPLGPASPPETAPGTPPAHWCVAGLPPLGYTSQA